MGSGIRDGIGKEMEKGEGKAEDGRKFVCAHQ